MDVHKLITKFVEIFESSTGAHWRGVKLKLPEDLETIRQAVSTISLCWLIAHHSMEKDRFLGIFDYIWRILVANILTHQSLSIKLFFQFIEFNLTTLLYLLKLPKPDLSNLAGHTKPALLRIKVSYIFRSSSKQAHVFWSDSPCLELLIPWYLSTVTISFQALQNFNLRARNKSFSDLRKSIILEKLFYWLTSKQFSFILLYDIEVQLIEFGQTLS